jgi:hypothetical protein
MKWQAPSIADLIMVLSPRTSCARCLLPFPALAFYGERTADDTPAGGDLSIKFCDFGNPLVIWPSASVQYDESVKPACGGGGTASGT